MRPDDSRQHVAEELLERAARFWGPERAKAIQPVLEEMAGKLLLLAQNPPNREEEPAFFLS